VRLPSPTVFLLLLSVSPGIAGCDRVNRVRDCRGLSALVNPALDAIEAQTKTQSIKGYRFAADGYSKLAQQIRKGREWPGPGKPLVDEYAGLFDSISPAVTAYANALEVKQDRSIDEARRTLDRLSKQQHSLVTRIDSYCQAP
jgi:hypothetical protein